MRALSRAPPPAHCSTLCGAARGRLPRAHTLTLTCGFFAAGAAAFTTELTPFALRVGDTRTRGVMMPASTLRFFVRRLTNHVFAWFASMPMAAASCVTRAMSERRAGCERQSTVTARLAIPQVRLRATAPVPAPCAGRERAERSTRKASDAEEAQHAPSSSLRRPAARASRTQSPAACAVRH